MNKIAVVSILLETSPQALPLGGACVASALKKYLANRENHPEIRLLTFSMEGNPDPETLATRISEKILGYNPDICCFSVYVWNREVFSRIARHLKQKNKIIIIAGGPEVTASPESFFPDLITGENLFDSVITGEGEKTLPKVIESYIKTGKAERIYAGEALLPEELTSPYLDGTIDPKEYGGVLWELARGCPFKCSYCYESKGKNTVSPFPMERLEAEIKLFKKQKIPQVFVLDPTYNGNKKRALEILRLIKENLPECFFYFECRSEFIDREIARAFGKINCSLQIGIQSTNPETLACVNRSFNKADFVKKTGILNREGIIFGFDLIYGLPKDNLEKFKESLDFAISLYPNHLEIFRLAVLPGTRLYDDSGKFGIEFMNKPPYLILRSPTFTSKDLEAAEKLAWACDFFYSKGRAVPWFNSLLKLLKVKASTFLEEFYRFMTEGKKDSGLDFHPGSLINSPANFQQPHKEIEKYQVEFVCKILDLKKLGKYKNLVTDIIRINGAVSRITGEGEESILRLSYHPENLLSPYSTDFKAFYSAFPQEICSVKIIETRQGPDYRILKS